MLCLHGLCMTCDLKDLRGSRLAAAEAWLWASVFTLQVLLSSSPLDVETNSPTQATSKMLRRHMLILCCKNAPIVVFAAVFEAEDVVERQLACLHQHHFNRVCSDTFR